MEILGLIIAALIGYFSKALRDTPREVRAHDRAIRYLDEDLLTWIKREDKQLKGRFFTITLENTGPNAKPKFLVAREKERIKRDVYTRFEAERREGIRKWEGIRDDQQLHHRAYRWLRRRPLPGLSHEEMWDALARWGEPEQPTELDPKIQQQVADMLARNKQKKAA